MVTKNQSIWQAALQALRPLHWIKSGFCLAALFMSGDFVTLANWIKITPLLVGMSLLSSGGYLLNDILNLAEDCHHPRKKNRPIASGALPVISAALLAGLVTLIGLGVMFSAYGFGWVSFLGLGYLGVSVSYNLILREIPLIDVLVLSSGFVIRVGAGAFALGYFPTIWLILCTFTVSLLLGFGKRKGEFALVGSQKGEIGKTRGSLRGYTMMLLDALVGLSALLTIGSYFFYVMTHDSLWFIASVVPVIAGVSEYLRWAWRSDQVEVPEKLLGRSPLLLGAVAVWMACIILGGL